MIERTTLDGEPCTAAYLDDEFEPADKDEAVLAKVFCDDGRIVWLTLRSPEEEDEAEDAFDADIARFFTSDAEGKDPVKEGWVGRASESGEFTSKGTGGGAKADPALQRKLSVRDILYGDYPAQKPRSKQVKDVARQLMQRGTDALKALGVESGRIEGPNPETDELLSQVIASEISDALSQTRRATDWYTHRVSEAMNIASEMYPELATDRHARTAYTAALAVTSQGEVVPSNVRLADQVYRSYRETGRFPTDVAAKEQISMNTNFKKLNGLLDAGSPQEMTEFLNRDFTVRELGTLGFDVGGENINTQVKGSAILGAKIGQGFFQNLNGNYDPVTMDLWFMRGWGRLTGTLQGQLNPGEFTKTRNRFETALRKAGETPAEDVSDLRDRAEAISRQHERDYRTHRAEFDSGERKKSELVLSAQRMVYAMDGINQAPRSGGHREWMRNVVNRTREVLAEQGTTLTNADIQATWWYPEKDLYAKLGSRESADINVDYSDALQDLARKNGISEEAIARAIRTVDRGPGRAAARDQRGGSQGVRAQGDRAAAPQARAGPTAFDRAIAAFFGHDREFKEHQHKRDEDGKFATQASTRSFVSPNVSEQLNLSQARQALNSTRQRTLAKVSEGVDRRLGLREAQSTAVIGAWADGAENSLMTVTSGDPQLIRAAAAIKGAIANQKAVLVFQPGEGEHEMASFAMQGDIADIHQRLLQGGLQFHTLEPTPDGARVHILVMDDETAAAITDVAGDTEIETVQGNGEFIGTTQETGSDAEQRADAQRAYREAIDQVAEQRQGQGPDLREVWSDYDDYWRAETEGLDGAIDRFFASDNWRSLSQDFSEADVKRDDEGKFATQAGGGGVTTKGIAARGTAPATSAMLKWVDSSPLWGKSVEEAMRAAHDTQGRLVSAGSKIAGTIRTLQPDHTWKEERNPEGIGGIVFLNPGAKTNVERIKEKLQKYQGYEGNVARITDMARGAFLIDDPAKVGQITEHLGGDFGVVVEDWRRTGEGYFDMAASVRDHNGVIAEIQFMPPEMDAAKNRGELPGGGRQTSGHTLYERWRGTKDPAEKERAAHSMRNLYNAAVRGLSAKWRRTLGDLGVS